MKNNLPEKYLKNELILLKEFQKSKVIPVVKVNSEEDAINTTNSLIAKGINIIEITYRTEKAGLCIKSVSSSINNAIVGAGTITNVRQAKDAISNGAKFLVMPGFDKKTVKYAIKKNIPVIPGVASPTEIMQAINCGLQVLKLFPCDILGGIDLLKALKGPFANVKFVPTGGINADNYQKYLALDNVVAVGGSWIVK